MPLRPEASTIPQEIVDCNFPDIGQVVLIGGGVLELAGFRVARNIDLVTTSDNIDGLKAQDSRRWHEEARKMMRTHNGSLFTRKVVSDTNKRFDIWQQWYDQRNTEDNDWLFAKDLINMSSRHKAGFYVLKASEVIAMKNATKREKDLVDVGNFGRIA